MNIFITGGSRGIGNNLVLTALKKGHNVAFTYHNPETDLESLLKTARDLAPNQKCRGYQLDVKNSEQVNNVADQVISDFDDIDAVINNAGINRNNLAFTMTDEEWNEVIATNLTGCFYVIRAFLSVFLAKRKGRFVSISSIAKDGVAGQSNYSASKAGLVGLSATIAKEYGPKGITSNVVVPGLFETDMTREYLSDDLRKFWIEHCPAGRMGKLEELSEVILFLISDEASFINSQVIPVTGGLNFG